MCTRAHGHSAHKRTCSEVDLCTRAHVLCVWHRNKPTELVLLKMCTTRVSQSACTHARMHESLVTLRVHTKNMMLFDHHVRTNHQNLISKIQIRLPSGAQSARVSCLELSTSPKNKRICVKIVQRKNAHVCCLCARTHQIRFLCSFFGEKHCGHAYANLA